jgi:hypothetical protein
MVASASAFVFWTEDEVVFAPVGYRAACCGARRLVAPVETLQEDSHEHGSERVGRGPGGIPFFAAHDTPGLMALLDEEIEWHEPDVDVPWRPVSETMVTLAAIRMMLQRLVHSNRKRQPAP